MAETQKFSSMSEDGQLAIVVRQSAQTTMYRVVDGPSDFSTAQVRQDQWHQSGVIDAWVVAGDLPPQQVPAPTAVSQ